MKKDTVVELKKPEAAVEDPLMEILRRGARELLTRALESEVESFTKQFDDVRDASGKRVVTRNGYSPERTIQTRYGRYCSPVDGLGFREQVKLPQALMVGVW